MKRLCRCPGGWRGFVSKKIYLVGDNWTSAHPLVVKAVVEAKMKMTEHIQAGKFKARCLKLMDKVYNGPKKSDHCRGSQFYF